MGNQNAVTTKYPWEWKTGPPGEAGYDDAGFIPFGMTYANQTSYSEPANYGGKNHMRTQLPVTFPQFTGTLDWGATEGLLTSYGTPGGNSAGISQLYDIANGLPSGYNQYADGQFGLIHAQPLSYQTWENALYPANLEQCGDKIFPGNPPTCALPMCNPTNFPYCTMIPMIEASAQATFFDQKTQNAGRIYRESANRAYNNFFLSGGPEALEAVNTSEHSTFDPCSDPSLVEFLLPLAGAIIAVGVYTNYGKPEVTLLANSQIADAGDIILFFFAYNYVRGVTTYFFEPSNKYFERAARALAYPLGLAVGYWAGGEVYGATSQQASLQTFQYVGMAAGLYLTENALVPALSVILSKSGAIPSLIIGSLGWLTHVVSKFWCMFTSNLDSCEQWDDQDNGLQDSRRWDVVSIASKLTLEVCEREGWQKNDPRAEFVFRGLITGPAMLTAPMDQGGNKDNMFQNTLVNPLGFVYQGRWQQAYNATDFDKQPFPQFQRSQNIAGWDGDIAGAADVANSNLYSCENWDVMRNAKQQVTHAQAFTLRKTFDKWIGSTEYGGGTLVNAANDPNQLALMKRIPGWELGEPLTILPIAPIEMPLSGDAGLSGLYAPGQILPPGQGLKPLVNKTCRTFFDDILTAGNGNDKDMPLSEISANALQVLSQADCSGCPLADLGKVYLVYILALDDPRHLTCGYLEQMLQWENWTDDAIKDMHYVLLELQGAAITSIAQFARQLLNDGSCTLIHNPVTKFNGFASLPSSITDQWCVSK
jgi:hypothetical protein